MTDLASRLRRRGLAPVRKVARAGQSNRALKRRIRDLEEEMQEARRLNRRLAELMDVVEELLLPIAQRDEEKIQQYLASNTTVLGNDTPRKGSSPATGDRRPGTR